MHQGLARQYAELVNRVLQDQGMQFLDQTILFLKNRGLCGYFFAVKNMIQRAMPVNNIPQFNNAFYG